MNVHPSRGLSLIEVTVGLALAGVVASMALPSYQQQLAKAKRAEAVSALTRLMMAQEEFRANHGSYALNLMALKGLGGPLEHFDITLVAMHGSAYIARASARPDTPVEGGCQQITLSVADGHITQGPSEHCWNR
jgi:type IV pilus assembly protein PilE